MKKFIISSLLSAITLSLSCTASANDNKMNESVLPKNIIMIVGDGMGPAYTTAYRYFNDDPNTEMVEETVFDRNLVGMSSTYPAKVSGYVTDSAASATALSSGIKTYNNAIGVDVNENPVETVLEWAKKQGKKTAVVVTSQINHATPASYLAHNKSRRNYNEIADSYIDNGIKADLYFGGGWDYFIREDRDLVAQFKQNGFHYIDDYSALNNLPKNQPVLGLFGKQSLPWALDDDNKHRLSTLTQVATTQLENDNGYFMLVEASQIDWGGHANDIAASMAEMDDLAKTIEFLEKYVQLHPDTLVILTADHSTGGFTIGANGEYAWRPDVLKTMKRSTEIIAKRFVNIDITKKAASELLNFTVTDQEVLQLQQEKINAKEALVAFEALSEAEQSKMRKPDMARIIRKAVLNIIDQRTNTGWTTSGHTAVDVPVFAFGKESDRFSGKLDNTDIAKKIFTLLGKE